MAAREGSGCLVKSCLLQVKFGDVDMATSVVFIPFKRKDSSEMIFKITREDLENQPIYKGAAKAVSLMRRAVLGLADGDKRLNEWLGDLDGAKKHLKMVEDLSAWKNIQKVFCADDKRGLYDALAEMGEEDQLYIVGHCGEGLDFLQGDNKEKVDSSALASLVKSSGLPSTFSGRIKIYACKSGSSTFWRKSFIQKFQIKMAMLGYFKATIIGYNQELRMDVYAAEGAVKTTASGTKAHDAQVRLAPPRPPKT